ncbi:flavin reductase family protein [Staphylococcus succinus]|uniref:flavin reductase family protein n=1 Tax=Staphylococcus succinus TaxID=61015 RepID=UPI00062BC7CE|nr:flavin reductase family protein [Staphylococcus succinus]MDH9161654.1 flavin reductase family protein [Staphylococcus succinus]PNZ15971.1 flavin reductase family protein [Staphylococcus succinus subsp. succinus]
MKKLLANQLSDVQNYKLLSGSIIPRPIAFVTSQNNNGVLNAAPFSFFNIVNNAPPMISISAQRAGGKRKDTALNIEEVGEFVVHITDENNVENVNITAAQLKPEENELDHTKFTLVDSENITVPGIKEAKIRLECKLERIVEIGSKDDGADLIIGEVVKYHIDEDIYFGDSKIDALKLEPVARLAGNDYAKSGDTFTIERPE